MPLHRLTLRAPAGRAPRAALALGMAVLTSLPLSAQERPTGPGPGGQAAPGKAEAQYKGKPTGFWVKQLSGQEVTARREAVQALAGIGPGAAAAVPALLEALRDDDTA